MANRYAGLDPTWAHLPTPAPTHAAAIHYCSSRAAAFENEALTSALRASMAPVHGSAAAATSSFSTPATPSSSTSSASELLSSGHDAPTTPASCRSARPPARALKGPKGGGVSKRKPRPSRRAPTTYFTADPANFRRLVQEITGLPIPVSRLSTSSSSFPGASEAATAAAAAPAWMPAPTYVLPTLDTSAFLLDHATTPTPAAEEKSSSGPASATTTAPAATVAVADDSSLLMEMDAITDFFPTLESWGFI